MCSDVWHRLHMHPSTEVKDASSRDMGEARTSSSRRVVSNISSLSISIKSSNGGVVMPAWGSGRGFSPGTSTRESDMVGNMDFNRHKCRRSLGDFFEGTRCTGRYPVSLLRGAFEPRIGAC